MRKVNVAGLTKPLGPTQASLLKPRSLRREILSQCWEFSSRFGAVVESSQGGGELFGIEVSPDSRDGFRGKPIATLIALVSGMTFEPMPSHFMLRSRSIQLAP